MFLRGTFLHLIYRLLLKIEQKGKSFYHDFGYAIPLFIFPSKKKREEEKENKKQNRAQKSCISARSLLNTLV